MQSKNHANKYTKMIGNSFLLDTNIIIALLKGESLIAEKIDKAENIYIPVIVIGELYYGSLYSSSSKKNFEVVERLARRYNVLQIDEAAARSYGSIKTVLRKKGTPIPENDIWIAALAQHHELIIVTRDKHFREVESVHIENW